MRGRAVLQLVLVAGLVSALLPGAPRGARAQVFDTKVMALLMQPQPLPDEWIGRPDAPVTLIEYASPSCTHCATFQRAVLPGLKRQYVETGKLRIAIRDWPVNDLSLQASMLARCAGPRREEVLMAFMTRWMEWAMQATPDKMLAIAEEAGVSRAAAATCLQNKAMGEAIRKQYMMLAPLSLGLVPAFFVNGVRYDQFLPDDAIDKALPSRKSETAAVHMVPQPQSQPQSQPRPSATPEDSKAGVTLIDLCNGVTADKDLHAAFRAADEKLMTLVVANLQLATRFKAFEASCQAVGGRLRPDIANDDPRRVRFVQRLYEMNTTRGRVFEGAEALRALLKTEPLASLAKRGTTVEFQGCVDQISRMAGDTLKQADTLANTATVDCP
jgi:protein-disulfide isomerase